MVEEAEVRFLIALIFGIIPAVAVIMWGFHMWAFEKAHRDKMNIKYPNQYTKKKDLS